MSAAKGADLDRYWDTLFPVAWKRVLVRIATCDGRFPLERRELAPRWASGAMKRYQTYGADVPGAMRKLRPHALQFGGILERGLEYGPEQRAIGELVFDVDMDDYDRAGVCECVRGRVCAACWTMYMEPARAVLDYVLRTWFGFRKLLHVFSGRRGFHVWVLDMRAVLLTSEQRKAVVDRIVGILSVPDALCAHVRDHILRPMAAERNRANAWQTLFPKLDVNVSRSAGHLKKMPLTIHQTTMYIALPLLPVGAGRAFDPVEDAIRPADANVEFERMVRMCEAVLNTPE